MSTVYKSREKNVARLDRCNIGFCVECAGVVYNGKYATSHTVVLPGGSEYEVITNVNGEIVYDSRPWQWQPGW